MMSEIEHEYRRWAQMKRELRKSKLPAHKIKKYSPRTTAKLSRLLQNDIATQR